MKILLDNKTKSYRLNANEACIYACIAKCTRAGRGWFGNYAALAEAMPFVMERTTAYRAVQKLLTLGLIEKRDDNHLYAVQIATDCVQIATDAVQIATDSVQIATESVQIAIPPTTPLNNNMNDIKKEEKQPRALYAHAGAKQLTAFDDFKELFIKVSSIAPEGGENWFKYRGAVCEQKWAALTELKRRAIIRDLQRCYRDNEKPFKDNPYYYLYDFPDPQPEFLTGLQQDNARAAGHVLVQVKYNDRFLICTQSTAEDFNLDIIRLW